MRRGEQGYERNMVPPAVIEPETFGTEEDDASTVVWIPTASEWHGDDAGPELALRALDDGGVALLVHSCKELMAQRCGEQPYIEVVPELIQEIQYMAGADLVLWDAVIDPVIWQSTLTEPDESGERT